MSGIDCWKHKSRRMSKVFLYTILLLWQYMMTPPILGHPILLAFALLEVFVRQLDVDVKLTVKFLLQESIELGFAFPENFLDQRSVILQATDDNVLFKESNESLMTLDYLNDELLKGILANRSVLESFLKLMLDIILHRG